MQDGIYPAGDKDIIGNVMLNESKAGIASQMGYIIRRSRDQVIQA
jgi:hypothetical protein